MSQKIWIAITQLEFEPMRLKEVEGELPEGCEFKRVGRHLHLWIRGERVNCERLAEEIFSKLYGKPVKVAAVATIPEAKKAEAENDIVLTRLYCG